jgi:UDP-3-O-[3-hydroxymyristoyl] glucosamine N-acyltransferase
MTDSPPARRSTASALTLREVSDLLGGRRQGPAELRVEGVAPVDEAGPTEMGFLGLRRYVRFAGSSQAGSFLVSAELEGALPAAAPRVVVAEPYRALGALLDRMYPEPHAAPTVHPTAVLGQATRLGEGVRIEPYAVIGDRVSIGAGTRIGAHCVLGADTRVGAGCTLHPHVVAYPGTVIGRDVVLHSGVRVGCDGFGYTAIDGAHHKMPQVGRAVIGDGVEIGANSTVDRGSLGDTVVGDGVKIDNLVQVAHNVRVGAGSLLAALVGIAGSTRIGRGVWLGGRASAINHLEIGDGARVTFGSTVTRDVAPGETVSGYPARPHREELRRQAELGRVSKLGERVRRLEEALLGRPPRGRDATRQAGG